MTIRRIISISLKIVVAIASLAYLIYKAVVFDQWCEALENLSTGFGLAQIGLIFIILLLLPVNYGIETYKWHLLILTVEKISLKRAVTGVLIGLSSSVFTPNRMGDIFTRPMVLQPSNRITGIALSLINSLSETLSTLLIGMASLIIYLPLAGHPADQNRLNWPLILLLFTLLFLLFIMLFAKLTPILRLFGKIKWFKWLNNAAEAVSEVSLYLKVKVLLLACLRYAVFATQFYLFLVLFKLDLPIITMYAIIGTLYLLLSLNPVPALGDIGVRGSISIFLLSPFTGNLAPMVFSIMGIWLLNIMVPALAGVLLLRRINI